MQVELSAHESVCSGSFDCINIGNSNSPARCKGVELRPCVSLQLMFSGVDSFMTCAK